jgi:hypothetical protein
MSRRIAPSPVTCNLKRSDMSLIFAIEEKRTDLLRSISGTGSYARKIYQISGFYSYLLSLDNKTLVYTYILEFIHDYSQSLKFYTAFYTDPGNTEQLLAQIRKILILEIDPASVNEIRISLKRIDEELQLLYSLLNGDKLIKEKGGNVQFPVLEISDSGAVTGLVENIIIEINKGETKNEIIIIPSETEIEERLLTQVNTSLQEALKYIGSFSRKVKSFHKVIIQFDKRIGFYVGDSMGTGLTLGFIEKLIELYEVPYKLKINNNVVFTGGIREGGDILPVAGKIKEKLEIVFFSDAEFFAIPQQEADEAEERLKELQQKYPLRKLVLLPVKNVWDIIDRRSIVQFRKKNMAERGGSNLRKNWMVYLLLLMLTATLYLTGVIDMDENPGILEMRGEMLHVLNKNRKELWNKKINLLSSSKTGSQLAEYMGFRLLDTDNDGYNEIYLSQELLLPERIACFNYKGELRWEYMFEDTIANEKDKEGMGGEYYSSIIESQYEDGRLILFCVAKHAPNYATAIYKLDAATGKRLQGTLWHAGHVNRAYIDDFNEDGKKELVLNFINNGYEACGMASINIEEIRKNIQFPTTPAYTFYHPEPARYNKYILFPKTDYSLYNNERFNWPGIDGFLFHRKKFHNCINEGPAGKNPAGIIYYCDENMEDFSVEIGDKFRVMRDSLVVKDLLSYPLTDTREYRELLIERVINIPL